MKTALALIAASLAKAFVIPSQQQLSLFGEVLPHRDQQRIPQLSDDTQLLEDETYFLPHAVRTSENIGRLIEQPHKVDILPFEPDDEGVEHGGDWDNDWEDNYSIQSHPDAQLRGGHHPGHGHFNMTLYEMIKSSSHTKIFAKLVDKFDDVVDILNSTSSNHTVFIPTDKAFEEFRGHPHVSDKLIKKVIMYHIAPEQYPTQRVFTSRTVPTLLEPHELGHYPQRICTQFGLKGLTLNFFVSIIKSNLYGTNGVAHGLNHILIPPFPAAETINFVPTFFSTFELGLFKTGLFKYINDTSTHSGATFFAPTNHAFRKLGFRLNAFLFSRCGEKYLDALLKYHISYNRTLYSDAYNKPKHKDANPESIHVDLPTLLKDHHLSIDIEHINRFVNFKINGFTSVTVPDAVARDGVIHVLNRVLIPPCHPRDKVCRDNELIYNPYSDDEEEPFFNLTVEDLIDRLDPYLEN
ncbi:hypothetical protein AJ79_05935 [Helicocarpus griseus UAMH5409]|uniref:FAS1 domain-containing protein n=1 Tax=Helicocarpus griseus UAMH5409 TaxID=1447875 RepID=A0A2B7XIR0_9EURO|nr:hypothetical protein AJ79_05935 [Helicocarpus griseus UAMH5409]